MTDNGRLSPKDFAADKIFEHSIAHYQIIRCPFFGDSASPVFFAEKSRKGLRTVFFLQNDFKKMSKLSRETLDGSFSAENQNSSNYEKIHNCGCSPRCGNSAF